MIQSMHLQGVLPLGPVHKLPSFDKKRHTLPTVNNEYTQAFLGRLIEDELTAMVEERFKELRGKLQYKRREISATCQSPSALIQTKDFDYEFNYELDPDSPNIYRLQQKLVNLSNPHLLDVDAFNQQFTETFDTIVIEFKNNLNIERIIDAFEDDESATWTLDYPSDYTYCTVEVPETAACIHFTHHALNIQAANRQSPRELYQHYQKLRSQFNAIQGLALLL